MPFFNRLTAKEIRQEFKFKGLLFGIVPIYISDDIDPAPAICTRNWVPEWTLDVVSELYFFLFDLVDPHGFKERAFPITITGRIK